MSGHTPAVAGPRGIHNPVYTSVCFYMEYHEQNVSRCHYSDIYIVPCISGEGVISPICHRRTAASKKRGLGTCELFSFLHHNRLADSKVRLLSCLGVNTVGGDQRVTSTQRRKPGALNISFPSGGKYLLLSVVQNGVESLKVRWHRAGAPQAIAPGGR